MGLNLPSRRQFLGSLGIPAAAVLAPLPDPSRARAVAEAFASSSHLPPSAAARDESLWFEVQQSFTIDRNLLNLNNGGVSPSPASVQKAMKRYLDISNEAPSHSLWRVLEPRRETVRDRLARFFRCDSSEVAITRNASESLQICQLGFDLEPGDEVLTTDQDYPRMITTFKQRERREGIVLKQFSIPSPSEDDDEIVRLFEERITAKTRLILMCHVINLTGQILPVKAVVRMARRRGVPVIVDGAHGFAHMEFDHADLDCDYYATSLHKWLLAPHGTGFLYVRKEKIADLWPMMAAPDAMRGDIRKFEEIGTHPAANALAIGEALTFHLGIGSAQKESRLRFLRDTWAERLLENDRVRLHTSLDPRFSCGIATVQIDGVDTGDLCSYIWKEHRIITSPIRHEQFEGLRISPNLYTTLDELDRFCDVMERVVEDGLPG